MLWQALQRTEMNFQKFDVHMVFAQGLLVRRQLNNNKHGNTVRIRKNIPPFSASKFTNVCVTVKLGRHRAL